MNKLRCNLCGKEYYVNPPIMRQKKTRCPHCGIIQPLENYDKSPHGSFRWIKSQSQFALKTEEIGNVECPHLLQTKRCDKNNEICPYLTDWLKRRKCDIRFSELEGK